MKVFTGILLAAAMVGFAGPASPQSRSDLKVGAAKVSITPPDDFFPYPQAKRGFVGVHDPIFARVIVVDDGSSEVALVGLDLTMVQAGSALPQKIGAALGIPADHVMVSATHDHNTPNQGRDVSVARNGHRGRGR